MKRKTWLRFFAACCIVTALLLFGRTRYDMTADYWQQVKMNCNLHPLQTVFRYFRLLTGDYSPYLRRHAFANLVGNVLLFIPLGYFPPLLWESFRPLWRCLLWSALIITAAELLQLLTLLGRCDIDDLLLNLLGTLLGHTIYRLQRTFSSPNP